jgi:exopolysaccharide production protein ExoZ
MVIGALDTRFADWRFAPLRALGDSSYSLYLTHLFTLGLLRVVWSRVVPPIESWLGAATFMAAALVGASVVGWLTFRLVETPMLEWLNSRTKPRRVVQASTP